MSLHRNILLVFSIAFFTFCIILIVHLFFSSPDSDIRRAIFTYLLIYGGLISAFEIFKHRNEPNFGISPISATGATLGFIAAFYFSYQICILSGIFDGTDSIETSSVTLVLSFVSAEVGRQIGSYLGSILLP